MKYTLYTLSSFAKIKYGGNPAGVVLKSDGLSENYMKQIAKKAGFSETAFVQKSEKANFKVKFFTPTEEVDICGHATIAAFFLLKEKGIIKSGKYTQETKAGILSVDVGIDGTVFMEQSLPRFFDCIDKKEIADCLRMEEKYMHPELPVQIVSTGSRDVMVPVKSLKSLLSIKPDFDKITSKCKEYDANGFDVFTLETKFNAAAHCRNFAPLVGIPEESATGITAGALSCYLFEYEKVTEEQANNLVFEQGYSMSRPSEILAKLSIEGGEIKGVRVGGTATISNETEISV
ncbi:MAG: PhzF family phenazine biosynthesis protein [Candidatus Aenigmarchaeota archaeon]|nr:PhzF family phenazine biosynthesis protein [Candidatus Aenigmarchaeota archaeon]MDI6722065.1 PhzF family phenazine biosynthesis protein [Candidatus Aenigmarchaeota archaeon]